MRVTAAAMLLVPAFGWACAPGPAVEAPAEAVGDAAPGEADGSSTGFDPIEPSRIEMPELTADDVDRLLGTLDGLLADIETDDPESQARLHLWRFGSPLRRGPLAETQVGRMTAHLRKLAQHYPAADTIFGRTLYRMPAEPGL